MLYLVINLIIDALLRVIGILFVLVHIVLDAHYLI
jgi:hypothetical protein